MFAKFAPISRLLVLWQRLTEPAANIQDANERIRARFISNLLLLATILIVTILPLRYLTDSLLPDNTLLSAIGLIGGLLILIPYAVARRGHTRVANALVVIDVSLFLFLLGLTAKITIVPQTLNYLLMVVLFASHFTSIRFTLVTGLVQLVGIFVVLAYRFTPEEFPRGPLGFHVVATLIAVLFAYYRARIETQRQSEMVEKEAEQLKTALQRERLTLMNDFAQAFSHDFRTSLATIETSRYLLERTLGSDDREKLVRRLNVIRDSVQHMEQQLLNLGAILRLENLKLLSCDVNELLQTQINQQLPHAQQRGLTLQYQPDQTLPLIRADMFELGQAVKYVLENAIQYTSTGGAVTVKTARVFHQVAIEIRDTGMGIKPQQMPHIYDLFYRGDLARGVDSGGIGVGLSLARMIVEAHGGEITAQSQPGQGSVFTLSLPIEISTS